MKRTLGVLGLVCVFAVCGVGPVLAANSVYIETKNFVAEGGTGVEVGIFVENDVELYALVLPLEIREVTTGSYITSDFTFTVQGRIAASGLMDSPILQHNPNPNPSPQCIGGPHLNTYTGGGPTPTGFGTSPDGVMWTGFVQFSPLLATGSDGGTPSFLMTFGVTTTHGVFEIDTSCFTPANYASFTDADFNLITPSFTKGLVGIEVEASVQQVSSGGPVPRTFAVGQNYPNPFNAGTVIPFEVAYSSHVTIDVFDILGRRVATVVDADFEQGRYTADWNGTDKSGRPVATGVYFYRFSSDEEVTTRKMVLLK
jgi:hypothetical protein